MQLWRKIFIIAGYNFIPAEFVFLSDLNPCMKNNNNILCTTADSGQAVRSKNHELKENNDFLCYPELRTNTFTNE